MGNKVRSECTGNANLIFIYLGIMVCCVGDGKQDNIDFNVTIRKCAFSFRIKGKRSVICSQSELVLSCTVL